MTGAGADAVAQVAPQVANGVSPDALLAAALVLVGMFATLIVFVWKAGGVWSVISDKVDTMVDTLQAESQQRTTDVADIRADMANIRDSVSTATAELQRGNARQDSLSERMRRVEAQQAAEKRTLLEMVRELEMGTG